MRLFVKILGLLFIVLAVVALAPPLLQDLHGTFRQKMGIAVCVTAAFIFVWVELFDDMADWLQEIWHKSSLFRRLRAGRREPQAPPGDQLPAEAPDKGAGAEEVKEPRRLLRDTTRAGYKTTAARVEPAGDALPEPERRQTNARNALRCVFRALDGIEEPDTVSGVREAMHAAIQGQGGDLLGVLANGLFALFEAEIARKPEDGDLVTLGRLLKSLDGHAAAAAVVPQAETLPGLSPEHPDLNRTRSKLMLACYGLAQAITTSSGIAPVLGRCSLAMLAVLTTRSEDDTLTPTAIEGTKDLFGLVFPATGLSGR